MDSPTRNDGPTVSVVMCTYNGESYVRQQLESIASQSLAPSEIIIGDDGSTDRTLEIIADFAAGTSIPVHVISNPIQLGFADNFLNAAAQAAGDFVCFSDQDDIWRRGKIEHAVNAIIDNDALMSAHNVEFMAQDGTPLRQYYKPEQDGALQHLAADPWGHYYGFCITMRREVLSLFPNDKRGRDEYSGADTLSHDRWVYFICSNLGRVAELCAPLALYRQHGGQLFGGPGSRGLRQRLTDKLTTGHDRVVLRCEVAEGRAELLRSSTLPEPFDVPRAAAAVRWEYIAGACRLRERVYTAARLSERVSAWRDLRATGGYAGSLGLFGRREMVEDLVFGVALRGVQFGSGLYPSS